MTLMSWIWLAVVVGVFVLEAITTSLVAIWFVPGAIVAIFMANAGASFIWQLMVFTVITVVTLAATRPMVRKLLRRGKVATNSDRLLTIPGKVDEEINNLNNTGTVFIDGKTWKARSQGDSTIAKGSVVRVLEIQGVTLVVEQEKAASV